MSCKARPSQEDTAALLGTGSFHGPAKNIRNGDFVPLIQQNPIWIIFCNSASQVVSWHSQSAWVRYPEGICSLPHLQLAHLPTWPWPVRQLQRTGSQSNTIVYSYLPAALAKLRVAEGTSVCLNLQHLKFQDRASLARSSG